MERATQSLKDIKKKKHTKMKMKPDLPGMKKGNETETKEIK